MGHLLTRSGLMYIEFVNNIYRENRIPNEWRNAVITPTFKKGDRREPKNYTGISILNTCYKTYSKILNMKLQKYSEVFMTNTKWIPKGMVMHGPNNLP